MKARLAVLATMSVAVVLSACGDPTSLKAGLLNSTDTLFVYALTGTPPSYPSGVSIVASQAVRVDGFANFDVALDIDPAGRPPHLENGLEGDVDLCGGQELAVKQMTNKPPTANSKGLRFGNFVQGRTVIEEELEAVFSGKKEPKPALDEAVKRGNEILRQFEAANK